jgi:hypothetical protein
MPDGPQTLSKTCDREVIMISETSLVTTVRCFHGFRRRRPPGVRGFLAALDLSLPDRDGGFEPATLNPIHLRG